MSKIIIHNNTNLPDKKAVSYILNVILQGKISETAGRKHYCYCCVYREEEISVTCINRGVDKNTFYIENENNS